MKTHTFRDWHDSNRHQFSLVRFASINRPYAELGGWQRVHFRLEGYLGELWYYLKCRLWKKYNVVRIRSLAPTYHDDVEMLIHAMFQVLVNSVEKDMWLDSRCYYEAAEDAAYTIDGRDEWQEVATLYDWWMNVRPARQQAEDDALTEWAEAYRRAGGSTFGPDDGGFRQMHFAKSEEADTLSEVMRRRDTFALTDDEEKMIRLCKMRNWLWT